MAVNGSLSPELGTPGTAETSAVPPTGRHGARSPDAFTASVAYVNHREAELGTLRPGALADIAVLGQDILAIPAAEIGSTRVELTIVDGHVVHGDE